jgi:uncharacterized membrane protein YgcG
MSFKTFSMYRIFQVAALSAVVLFTAAATATAGSGDVTPVTNLHLVSGSASNVKFAWNAPTHGSTSSATIDEYIIKRDGHKLLPLQGFNGMVDTTYVDENPSQKKAKYTVIAVDSDGKRSPPALLGVPAPQSAAQNTQQTGKDDGSSDIIQSSSLCDSIVPTDIRGHNAPTGLETYGCGSGMSSINDDSAPKTGLFRPGGDVKRPFHDLFQNVFIQLPVSIGQALFLMVSALYIWVMSASTYLGIGKLFAGLLQSFHGNPNYPDLIILAVAGGLAILTLNIFKGDVRKGHLGLARMVLALTFLTIFLSGINSWMSFATKKPLEVYSVVSDQVTSASAGTDVSRDFNLTVHPTYGGDKTKNAIRKAENADWLMWQYLPQCQINFGNFQWAINNDYPKTHTTWCEKFVQVWGSGSDNDKDKFKSALKDANEERYTYFEGKSQMNRVMDTDLSRLVLMMHLTMKGVMKLSVFTGILMLLGELLFAVAWLFSNVTGSEGARYSAERRARTMGHWLWIAFIMTLFSLVYLVLEANIISASTTKGFLTVYGLAFLLECVVAFGVWKYFKKLHREHQESMQRLGAYREQSSGWLKRAAGYAVAGLTAGASSEYMRERAEKKRGNSKSQSASARTHEHNVPEDYHPDNQLLAEHSTSGAQSWDAEADAVEEAPLLLESRTRRGPRDGRSDGYGSTSNGRGPRSPNGSSGGGGSAAEMDGDDDYGVPIFDADVVDEDADVMERDSRYERERRMDHDLRDERLRLEREERERRKRRDREERGR